MRSRLLTALTLAALLVPAARPALGQHLHPHDHAARAIDFPDVPGYVVLATDLHMHTVFSDGSVWPDIRVEEAERDGLDAIAITEHLEYQPHAADLPHPDRNRAHAVATAAAGDDAALLIINGSEITRSMPPGHANAIFVQDANALLHDDPMDAYRAANAQGAFVFWNHPNWTAQVPSGRAVLSDFHRRLIEEGLLHGIEVVNEHTYSDEALQIALDHGLTILGTSDIHGLIDWAYDVPHGGHRPVTLVFATERTPAALKEALEAGRTVVYFDDLLIGREAWVRPLVEASLHVAEARYGGDTAVLDVTIENRSDAPFVLANRSPYTFHAHADLVTLPPHAATTLQVKTGERTTSVDLAFEVLNAVVAPATHPTVTLSVAVE